MEKAMVWNNTRSFKSCVEGMRVLRQSQHSDREVTIALLGNMPALYLVSSVREIMESRCFISKEGWLNPIPVERVVWHECSQN